MHAKRGAARYRIDENFWQSFQLFRGQRSDLEIGTTHRLETGWHGHDGRLQDKLLWQPGYGAMG